MSKEKRMLEGSLEELLSALDTVVEARTSARKAINDSINMIKNCNFSSTSELEGIEDLIKEFKAEQTVRNLIKIASFISTVSNNCIDDDE